MDALPAGMLFAGHRVEAQIGAGGMGDVYLVTHLALDVERVLKLIAPDRDLDPAYRERFRREAQTAARIHDAHVVPVYDHGEWEGALWVTMRYIDGLNLRELIAREGRLEPVRAARILADAGAGLDAAHRVGVVHRDVKPANILVSGDAGAERAFVTDFGLTRIVGVPGGTVTGSRVLLGTPPYVAPEQITDPSGVDGRADVYGLGCTLYEALTGRRAFPHDDLMPLLSAHLTTPPPPPSEIRPDLAPCFDRIVARALAKDPDERYPSAGDLARDVDAAARGAESITRERSVWRADVKPGVTEGDHDRRDGQGDDRGHRRRRVVLAAATAVLVAAAVLAAVIRPWEDDSPPPPSAPSQLITVGTGIADVAVGMPAAEVRQKLGDPIDRRTQSSELSGRTVVMYVYPGNLEVTTQQNDDGVLAITATGPDARTARGIGVGSTRQEVLNGVDGVTCDPVSGRETCRAGSGLPGDIITDFFLTGDRVTRVTVGRVLD